MTAATSPTTGATLTPAGGAAVRVVGVRILTPWKGVWIADLDLDPGASGAPVPTSGKATLAIGSSTTLQGTIDPNANGRFVSSVAVRLIGGGGGWDQLVAEQDRANDAGVQSSDVEQEIAALVGETVVDNAPIVLGVHWTRAAGPASRVFEDPDRDWYVDPSGVTQVASRPSANPDASLQILSYDPLTSRVEVSCDVLVLPGTTLTDARFDGTLTVRKVEQTFTRDGSRATCWCSSTAIDPLLAPLVSLVRELAGVATLRAIPYRYVSAGSNGRINLQAVDKPQGQPDLQQVTIWAGAPGDTAKIANSTSVLVVFVEGQKSQPVVLGFDRTLPLERTVDATTAVHVGPSATSVDLAGGEGGALVLATPYQQLLTALQTFAASLAALTSPPLTPVGAAGTALQTALLALPAPATTKVTAQ